MNSLGLKHYRQFCMDLPRLEFYINDKLRKEEPEIIKNVLFEKLDSLTANECIYMLTQTFLADFYIDEFNKNYNNGIHLLDDGLYEIKLNTDKKIMNFRKNFKEVVIDDDTSYIVDFVELCITVNLETLDLIYIWKSEFETKKKAKIVHRDQ